MSKSWRWLRAFSFPNRLVSTVRPREEFLTLLCRWDGKLRGCWRPLCLDHCRVGDWWTWWSPSSAVCCAWGLLLWSWILPMGTLEVSGSSAIGARVGSGVLLGAHNCAQTLAGPEATDVRVLWFKPGLKPRHKVTSDRRIFSFCVQISLLPTLPVCVVGWG